MPSFQISLSPAKQAAAWFIATVRREIQKALAEEHQARGLTQAAIAAELGVNRSVIHRQIVGFENLTLGRVGEIASILGREVIFLLVKPDHTGNQLIVPPPQLGVPQSAVSSPFPIGSYFSGRPQAPVSIG